MKIRQTIALLLFALLTIAIVNACKKAETQLPQPTAFIFITPTGFPPPESITFQNNPLTIQGIELGRKLFYDGRLSKDGNFPCASCHQQFAGFATYDHSLSHGFNNQFTTRNAPGLFNLAWQKSFHWDGGINHLEVQPLAPIIAPNEMAETVENVVSKLKADTLYQKMFRAAFQTDVINSQNMLKALAQFVGTLVSADSKYDKVSRRETVFTAAEQRGYEVFKLKCASCHKEPLFTDLSFRNIGLPMDPDLKDNGRMTITQKSQDSLLFKVPSLRNVALTAPYSHDGRFASIGAVIDHYRFSVVNGPTTDPVLRNKIKIDDFEKLDLLNFLQTLTDTAFVHNKKFAQPTF
jgi:cytochrome c peroxidase